MALATVLRALFGYFFLVFIVRIVGRRSGKQLTPFEFVMIFFLGGLTLTGMVGRQASVTNAFCQIIAVASGHFLLTWLRSRSSRIARLLDGTPLMLLEGSHWRSRTMRHMRVSYADVMQAARKQGIRSLSEIDTAVLERNGDISIIPIQNKK